MGRLLSKIGATDRGHNGDGNDEQRIDAEDNCGLTDSEDLIAEVEASDSGEVQVPNNQSP